jgi:two-component system, OmpR family, phosphate regulon response regulator PhoB
MARVLVVEDNQNLAEGLRTNLEFEGHEAEVARDGVGGLIRARTRHHDLIVLDLMLPGLDGFRVLESLRAEGVATPVLVLTARGDEADKVSGLDAGADDYITKPFSTQELLARIRAVLRRRAPEKAEDTVSIGALALDAAAHRVTWNGRPVKVGPTEFKLLHFLMKHPERVHSRQQLLDKVWGDHVFIEERTVDVHIRRLRKALEATGHDKLVDTVRGSGYGLRKP